MITVPIFIEKDCGLMNQPNLFFREFLGMINLIFTLAKQDLKLRYLGSYLGILWAFFQPVITILIFWFVFQVGFRQVPVDNFPYILWLMCGLIPWFFLSDSISSSSYSVIDNSFLVKKVNFRVSILPLIKITSSLMIHVFFVAFLFIMFFIYGYSPTVYTIQTIYYLFASICLVVSLSWLTSSIVVFFRDFGQVITMLLQFFFWLTPIFWTFSMLPEKYHVFFRLNPFFYLIEGYRNSFIYNKWFWDDIGLTLYFWSFTIICSIIGYFVYKKLRPHFSDLL